MLQFVLALAVKVLRLLLPMAPVMRFHFAVFLAPRRFRELTQAFPYRCFQMILAPILKVQPLHPVAHVFPPEMPALKSFAMVLRIALLPVAPLPYLRGFLFLPINYLTGFDQFCQTPNEGPTLSKEVIQNK